jgi:multidrug efflux pump subunit AcrA (membrane-fusion protein)
VLTSQRQTCKIRFIGYIMKKYLILCKSYLISNPFISILGLLAFLIILTFVTYKAPSPKPVAEKTYPIQSYKITNQNANAELQLLGVIEAKNYTTVRSQITGIIEDINVEAGNEVKQHEKLLTTETIEAALKYQKQKAEVELIKAELTQEINQQVANQQRLKHQNELVTLLQKSVEREKKLLNKKVGSQARLDEAEQALAKEAINQTVQKLAVENNDARLSSVKARLASAIANQQLALLELDRSNVKAPFSGTITTRMVNIGDRITPNSALFENIRS